MKNNHLLNTDLSEPVLLFASRKKSIFITFFFVFIVIIQVCILIFGSTNSNEKWPIILGLILIIVLAVVSFLISSPKATYFRLSKEGFEQSYLYKKKFFLWKDIEDFGIHIILNGKPIIGFNVNSTHQDNSMYMKTSTSKMFDKMFDYKYQIADKFSNDTSVFLNYLNAMKEKYKNL